MPRRVRKVDAVSQFGHGVPISARISPAMYHAISVLVNSDLWDFQTISGFVLSALYDKLQRCEEEEPGVGEWHNVQIVEELIRVKEEQLRFNDVIVGLRGQLNAMADAGEWDDLKTHLENIMATIYNQPEGSRKQTYLQYMKEFDLRLKGFQTLEAGREGSREREERATR